MKIWNTKYALTTGITTHEVNGTCGTNDSMVEVPKTVKRYAFYLHGEGKDWHRTEESAIARAEMLRAKKIDSLKMQIKKLEKLKFTENED